MRMWTDELREVLFARANTGMIRFTRRIIPADTVTTTLDRYYIKTQ